MSRFDELCESYNRLINGADQYEKDCKNFAKNIVESFIDYLEAGRNDVVIRRFALEEDGFYHCNIELTLYEGPEKHASRGLVPEFVIKLAKEHNSYIVMLENHEGEFNINASEFEDIESSEDLLKLYDAIFHGIKSYYETPIDTFIRQNLKGKVNFG